MLCKPLYSVTIVSYLETGSILIPGLFNGRFVFSYYITSNGGIFRVQWIEGGAEANGRGLIWGIIHVFARRNWGKPRKPVKIDLNLYPPEYRTGVPPNRPQSSENSFFTMLSYKTKTRTLLCFKNIKEIVLLYVLFLSSKRDTYSENKIWHMEVLISYLFYLRFVCLLLY
jgi:hypothetical protein